MAKTAAGGMMLSMSGRSVRFRQGLPAEQVEADGYVFFEIRQPDGGTFRLYDFEYKVALCLDGRPLSEVAQSAVAVAGAPLSEDQLDAFVTQLSELGLLESQGEEEEEEGAAVDEMENAPTAGYGLAHLQPRPQASHEPDPTALMSSMSDLLAVSQSRTGEAGVPQAEEAPSPRESGAPLPPMPWPGDAESQPSPRSEETTQDLKAAAVRATFAEPGDGLAAGMGINLPEATMTAPVRKWWLWALIATALAGAIGFAVFKFVLQPSAAPVSVDTVLPSPSAVYRWFDTSGEMQAPAPAALVLPAGGTLVELREPGSRFRAGDILAVTDEGKRQSIEIDHLRERIAYYQQMLEAMTSEGNKGEQRQADLKLKEKRALLDEALATFAQVAIVASADGEVDSVLHKASDKVKAGEVVLTLKAHQARAVFKLAHDDAEQAQRLAFCRVLLLDTPHDCEFVGTDVEDTVIVELPPGVQSNPGQSVQLAKARFEGVFTVPLTAVLQVGNTERLFVASATGRVEVRAIAVADRNDHEVLVAQGLDVGDAVIVNARADLAAVAQVRVVKRVLQ